MVWKLNPVHKKLQARLEQMRKFRKQHDQLIQVIARVLKPATVAKNVEGAPGDAQTTATEQVGKAMRVYTADWVKKWSSGFVRQLVW